MNAAEKDAAGRAPLRRTMVVLGAAGVVYALLHVAVPDRAPSDAPGCTADLEAACFAEVDARGDVRFLGAADPGWYVDAETRRRVRERTDARALALDDLRGAVTARVGGPIARLLIDRAPADALVDEVARGEYALATRRLDEIVASLSAASAATEAIALRETRRDLDRLRHLRREQEEEVEDLAPARRGSFLWTSPALSMVEVLFWALFGVATQLLVAASESLRRGDFDPPARAVAYAKLSYGPILAAVFAWATIEGVLRLDFAVRAWALPLVGFLFGYASRRIARAIDAVLDRLSGGAESPAPARPEAGTARRRALIAAWMETARPADLPALRRDLERIARAVVEAEVAGREGR